MPVKRKKKAPEPASYQKRSYRRLIDHADLSSFVVTIKETDLHILASSQLEDQARHAVLELRSSLESYIANNPLFLSSLIPLPDDPLAPPMVKSMLCAAQAAEVGPMAAVAGATAEYVGKALVQKGAQEVVVENGGDIFMARKQDAVVGIFAGTSPLSYRVGLKIPAAIMPLGICTSSGTVGHSLSLGEADSVTVLAQDTSLADAVATRLGNEITSAHDINHALDVAQQIQGLYGVVIIRDEQLGAWGEVELTPLSPPTKG